MCPVRHIAFCFNFCLTHLSDISCDFFCKFCRTHLALSDISCVFWTFLSDISSCGHIWLCRTYLAGTGLSMPSPNYPLLCFPLSYRVAPVFVYVVSPPLGWSPLPSFLVIWSPSGDTRGPSVVFEAVDMPCPGPFHFSYSVDYIYDFCPLPDPDVGLSIFVCDVEHTSFHFGLCGRKFVLCLFGQCPGLCTICHSWQHAGVVGTHVSSGRWQCCF